MTGVHKRVRLKDIAAELGLSAATVSLCLKEQRGKYQVNAETVRKVREFAGKVGYVPDRAARNLKQGANRCVGLLTNHHWRAGQKCLQAVFAAEQQLTANNIECRQLSCRNQMEGIRQLWELNCREIILFDPVVEDLSYTGTICNLESILQKYPGLTIYAVDYSAHNDLQLPQALPLVRMGVKVWDFQSRLMEVMQKYYPGETMLHAWRCSMPHIAELRARAPEFEFHINIENPFKIGAAGAQQFLQARKKYNITNVFWGDDRMACGFVNELIKAGVNVPEEVNVISFDNLEFSRYLAIPLTTWGVPIIQHTKWVLEALLKQTPLPDKISLPVLTQGKSARLTDKMLAELAPYCQLANEEECF